MHHNHPLPSSSLSALLEVGLAGENYAHNHPEEAQRRCEDFNDENLDKELRVLCIRERTAASADTHGDSVRYFSVRMNTACEDVTRQQISFLSQYTHISSPQASDLTTRGRLELLVYDGRINTSDTLSK